MPNVVFSPAQIQHAIHLRQHFHRYPELAFSEISTAKQVTHELEVLGYKIRRGVAGTGVIADMAGNRPGPTIALRADMDALPINEQTSVVYRSAHEGVMHACGHDGHTASLLLAAAYLAPAMHTLPGNLRLVFQPAEENGQGAARIIEEGGLKGVEAIFAYHNRPGLPSGDLAVRAGPTCGGGVRYHVIITGKGGHSSRPHLTADPIYIATLLVQAWQGIISRGITPLSSGVLSVTRIQAGDITNLGTIPSHCDLNFSLRYDTQETRDAIINRLMAVSNGICDAWGAQCRFNAGQDMPPVINDTVQSELVADALKQVAGEPHFHHLDALPTLGGEDFAFYAEKIPGCMFFVGSGIDHPDLHSANYDYPDEILPRAASAFVEIARRSLLREHNGSV